MPRYHHGQLREAPGRRWARLGRAQGPEAVVLREAARQVGVSHNAGYRHFADRDALDRVRDELGNGVAGLGDDVFEQEQDEHAADDQ
jgi:AcrR family transcriptional regulator